VYVFRRAHTSKEEVAVFNRKLMPTALGLLLGFNSGAGFAQESGAGLPVASDNIKEPGHLALVPGAAQPNQDPTYNQRMADAIALRLHQSGQLRGYRVDIHFADGVAELSGKVADEAQRDQVMRIVLAVDGVQRTTDAMEFGGSGVVLTNQIPNVAQGPPPEAAGPQEPMSLMPMMPGMAPGMLTSGNQPPPMPPYAWPAFAPYNNYSRVAYPTTYPYEAFPFIGPMYPFPKIPLGWRSVSLTWEDGCWWYGRKATGHDWWRIRYN
jgi:BON domain